MFLIIIKNVKLQVLQCIFLKHLFKSTNEVVCEVLFKEKDWKCKVILINIKRNSDESNRKILKLFFCLAYFLLCSLLMTALSVMGI